MIEAEIGMMHLSIKEYQGLPATPAAKKEGWNRFSLKAFRERGWPFQHLDSRLPAWRTVKDYIFLVLSHPVCGYLLQQPWENNDFMANREEVETVADFIFLGPIITVDDDCSYEIKRHLLLGRKAMKNLHSILKGRDITLATKIHIVKAMIFPVVMYKCESWTKEGWVLNNWWFWAVVLEKTLASPLDCKEIKPILKEINPE